MFLFDFDRVIASSNGFKSKIQNSYLTSALPSPHHQLPTKADTSEV